MELSDSQQDVMRQDMAYRMAAYVQDYVKDHPDCKIGEEVDHEITERYELTILSPDELKAFIYDIQSKARQGLAIVI